MSDTGVAARQKMLRRGPVWGGVQKQKGNQTMEKVRINPRARWTPKARTAKQLAKVLILDFPDNCAWLYACASTAGLFS